LFLAKLDTRSEIVDFASAGHEPALLVGPFGQFEALAPTGPVLGLDVGGTSTFGEQRRKLSEQTTLVVVTDGITEARRWNGSHYDFFGSPGVVQAVQATRHTQYDPAAAVHAAAMEHMGGALRDDATVVVSRPSSQSDDERQYRSVPRGRDAVSRNASPGRVRQFTGIR
jgi:serine phosphatase RsbU (regulator of sigma subunit)